MCEKPQISNVIWSMKTPRIWFYRQLQITDSKQVGTCLYTMRSNKFSTKMPKRLETLAQNRLLGWHKLQKNGKVGIEAIDFQ